MRVLSRLMVSPRPPTHLSTYQARTLLQLDQRCLRATLLHLRHNLSEARFMTLVKEPMNERQRRL